MINILEVAHQGLRQGNPPVGGNVAVVGQGVIGLSALAYATTFGMRTAVLDIDPTRLQIAEEMGARLAVSPEEENAVNQVYDLFDGAGADATCEAASNWAGIRTAMEVTGIDGTVVIIARHTQHPDFNPVGHPFLGKRLRIVTTYAYPRHDKRSMVTRPVLRTDSGSPCPATSTHCTYAHARVRLARTTGRLQASGRG